MRAAAYASAAATGEEDVSSRASTSVGYALDAAGSNGREALDTALKAMTADAQLLDQGFSPVTIANSQLWPGRLPDWVSSSWAELRFTLLDADEDWHVWTSWYEERLAGAATNQDIEVARLRIDDKVWEEQPRVVNAHIKELIEERRIFQHAIADESENDLPDADAIPEQARGASQFTLDAQGLIDLVPDPVHADGLQREIYQEVRYKALGLAALGHNQLADLSEPIGRFLTAAPERIENVSITRLWSRGNTLRLRLKAHDATAASTDPTDLGGSQAEPEARFVAGNEIAHRRDVRQYLRARQGGHRQRAQPASPDVLDCRDHGGKKTCTCPPRRSATAGAPPR